MSAADPLAPPPPLADLSAETPVSVFLDFDGTLVDIAATHDAIVVPRFLRGALVSLGRRLEGRLAIVTGRSLDDLESHLGPVELAKAGSHGSDRRHANGATLGDAPAPLPEQARDALDSFAKSETGVTIEAKPHGAAIHYRARPDAAEVVAERARNVADSFGLTLKQGKFVVELLASTSDKGSALEAFLGGPPFAGSLPVFIGDDITDEDGFDAAASNGGFGILVGEPRETHARYRLDGTDAVYRWLELGNA